VAQNLTTIEKKLICNKLAQVKKLQRAFGKAEAIKNAGDVWIDSFLDKDETIKRLCGY